MDRATEILRVTERLYAAVAAPEQWSPALEAVVDLLHGDHAVFTTHGDGRSDRPFIASARIDEVDVARLFSADGTRLMGPLFGALPVGTATRQEIVSDADFACSAAYNEIIRPMNGFYSVNLRQEGATPFVLSVCRSQRADAFDSADATALRVLTPHLAVVTELHARLRAVEHSNSGLARLLDRLDSGVILTDESAHPSMINERAAGIIAEADGLTVDPAGLAASTPAATQQLRDAIAAMGRDAAIEPRRLRLERPSRRLPLVLTVLPIWRFDPAVPGAAAARVAILIAEPDAPLAIDRAMVAETFQLTPRESEIAVLLTEGLSREMIARRLALGTGTVREHLRHVFEKTGARSQPALVALLRGFVDPLH
jgi:DNA-binding CsgD family transcriptional regulator